MNTVPFRPLGNRYLVLPDDAPDESVRLGDMVIEKPKDVHAKPSEGTVMAKGLVCHELEIGAKVLFGKYSGYEQVFDGVTYKILSETELLGERIVTPFDEVKDVGQMNATLPPGPNNPIYRSSVFNSGDLPVLRCRNENGEGSKLFCDLPYGHVGHHEHADPTGSGGSIGWTNYDDIPF